MTDRWTDRLSDYLDDALSPADRAEMERHVGECSDCSEALHDLRALLARARELPAQDAARGPGADLWPEIEARLRDRPVREVAAGVGGGWTGQRLHVSLAQLAAACVAVAVLSSGIAWFANEAGRRDGLASGAARSGRVPAVTASSAPAEAAEQEIETLRRVLDSRRDRLDPHTFRAIEESLASLEAAVEDARRALEADPDDSYSSAHLEDLRQRHLELLRRAVDLAGGAE